MELKKDSELFCFLPTDPQSPLCLVGDRHLDRYLSQLSSCFDELDKKDSYQVRYHSVYELDRLIEEHTQQSTSHKMHELFAKLNEWQEREDIKEGMVIGTFANISNCAFTYNGEKYYLDYFAFIEQHTPWMNQLLGQAEYALLDIWAIMNRYRQMKKFRVSSILSALLTLIFFVLLSSKKLWDIAPFVGLFITGVPFILGGLFLYSLFQLLTLLYSNSKKIRQKVYDKFVAETERIMPRLHLILRFYQLWCDNENRPLPKSLQESRETVDRAASIHTMIMKQEIDEYLLRKDTWNDSFWSVLNLRCQGLVR